MNKLHSHGKHKMWLENQIIYIESEGPWNLEYFHEMHTELFNLVMLIKEQPYALLISLIGNGIPVKEGVEIHKLFVEKGNARAVAVNLSECTTKSITENVFSDCYKRAKLNYRIFQEKREAKQWLQVSIHT